MIGLKCTKVENNPERREAVLWIKDNDDNTPGLMKLVREIRLIDLIEVSVFDKKNNNHLYEFDECRYVNDMAYEYDGDYRVRKIMISYRNMEVHR